MLLLTTSYLCYILINGDELCIVKEGWFNYYVGDKLYVDTWSQSRDKSVNWLLPFLTLHLHSFSVASPRFRSKCMKCEKGLV
jgi:hypothetical protein